MICLVTNSNPHKPSFGHCYSVEDRSNGLNRNDKQILKVHEGSCSSERKCQIPRLKMAQRKIRKRWMMRFKWMNLYTYRVYKLGPENMFRLLCFLFSHPQSYNKISTTWREIILKKTWLYRYLEAILEGRQKHNQQTHPNWNRFSFSVTLETRPPSCSTFMSVPFVSAWGIGWMNGGLIFDSFFLHS